MIPIPLIRNIGSARSFISCEAATPPSIVAGYGPRTVARHRNRAHFSVGTDSMEDVRDLDSIRNPHLRLARTLMRSLLRAQAPPLQRPRAVGVRREELSLLRSTRQRRPRESEGRNWGNSDPADNDTQELCGEIRTPVWKSPELGEHGPRS